MQFGVGQEWWGELPITLRVHPAAATHYRGIGASVGHREELLVLKQRANKDVVESSIPSLPPILFLL
jgi:hypothetical protein